MNVEKNENQGFEKVFYTGVSSVSVGIFSPTREQLNKYLEYTPAEGKEQDELEYVKDDVEVKSTDSDGNETSSTHKQVNIDVWVLEPKFNQKHKLRFTITDKVRTSKTGKTQYVNQLGQTTWADVEENLQDRFTKFLDKDKNPIANKEFRPALMGEEQLYDFLAKWLNFSPFKETNNIFLDTKKLFKGNFSELNSLIADFADNTIAVAFAVKTKTDDDGDKKYQVLSNKFFFPGQFMKGYRNYARNNFEGLEKDKGAYDLKQFVKNVADSEYGIKDYFINQEIAIYDPNVDPVNSESSIVHSSDDSSY